MSKPRKPKPLPKVKKAASGVTALRPSRSKDDPDLVGMVGKHLMRRRSGDNRDFAHIHPSDISKDDWCPRRTYYQISSGKPEAEEFRPQMEMVFSEGHSIHTKWQTWLWEMGLLRGKFSCLLCGWEGWASSPSRCPVCHAQALDHFGQRFLRYREVPLRNEENRVLAHSDGDLAPPFDGLLEIKSVGPGTVRKEMPSLYYLYSTGEYTEATLWGKIKQPFPSHLRQGLIYCWLADRPRVWFVYEWKPSQQVRVYKVERNDDLISGRLESCQDIVHALDGGGIPRRPKGWDHTHSQCSTCPFNSECWSARR